MRSYTLFPLRLLLALILLFIGGGLLAALGALQYLRPELPDVAALRDVRLQVPLRIYSRDKQLIAQIGEQRRIPLNYENYPKQVIDAFLAAEDDRFFEHSGVDYAGLIRAIAANLRSGSKREGGGTITMQLARNIFLSPERSYRRKLLEIFLAWRIEHEFSKQEILALYLNKIFLGQRAYGVGAAAEVYFGKTVDQLDLAEIALIAGLPRAPSRDNPAANPEFSKQRRAYVLRRMSEVGFISEEQRETAAMQPIDTRLHGPAVELDAPYVAEMVRLDLEQRFGPKIYTDNYTAITTIDSRLQRAAQRGLRLALLEYDQRHGYRGPVTQVDLAKTTVDAALNNYWAVGGLTPAVITRVDKDNAVATTQDHYNLNVPLSNMKWAAPALPNGAVGKAPEQASTVVHPGDVVYLAQQINGSWRLMQIPEVQGAFVSVDPHDGAVAALVGGFDYYASKFNRAVQAKRQPGSSFKPFLYSAALEHGFTPASLVNDAPIVLSDPGQETPWRPQNNSREFSGPIRVREALVRSRNLVSIRIMNTLGTDYATDYMARFGFSAEQLPHNLTLALGATQVAPIEMAGAYSIFANGGFKVEPYYVDQVIDGDGKAVYEANPALACTDCETMAGYDLSESSTASLRVAAKESSAADAAPQGAINLNAAPRAISAQNAYLMTDMMKDVIRRGTATRALVLNRSDIAGKTGTTNDRRDAWFCGFNSALVGAAWVGFDQERPLGNGEEGGRTALPMWIYFMAEALRNMPEQQLPAPTGLVTMRIAADTGRPATAADSNTIFETFMDGHLPESGGSVSATVATPGNPSSTESSEGLF